MNRVSCHSSGGQRQLYNIQSINYKNGASLCKIVFHFNQYTLNLFRSHTMNITSSETFLLFSKMASLTVFRKCFGRSTVEASDLTSVRWKTKRKEERSHLVYVVWLLFNFKSEPFKGLLKHSVPFLTRLGKVNTALCVYKQCLVSLKMSRLTWNLMTQVKLWGSVA